MQFSVAQGRGGEGWETHPRTNRHLLPQVGSLKELYDFRTDLSTINF